MNDKKQAATPQEILVVEDNNIIQNVLQKTLLLTDYVVHSVRNGRDAVKMVNRKKGKYKAILLDLLMPIMDGVKAIREIRSLSNEKSSTIIIAITGNHDEYTAEQFQAMGFNAAIIKPVTSNEVLTTLERATDPKADKWLGITNRYSPHEANRER